MKKFLHSEEKEKREWLNKNIQDINEEITVNERRTTLLGSHHQSTGKMLTAYLYTQRDIYVKVLDEFFV